MNRLILIVFLFPSATGCWLAQVANSVQLTGSGNVITLTHDIVDFDGVHVENAFHVNLVQGDGFAVEVQADDNVMPYVEVSQVGSRLKVRLQPGAYSLRNVTLKALITMPNVRQLDASGASQMNLESIVASEPLELDVSGASKVTGEIDGPRVEIDLSGASRVELTGIAAAVKVEASGASTAELSDLQVEDANVEVSGASTARLFVTGRLDAQASGASNVTYGGDPELGSLEKSGASSIKNAEPTIHRRDRKPGRGSNWGGRG